MLSQEAKNTELLSSSQLQLGQKRGIGVLCQSSPCSFVKYNSLCSRIKMVNVAATHELSKTFPSPKRKFIVSVMLYNA